MRRFLKSKIFFILLFSSLVVLIFSTESSFAKEGEEDAKKADSGEEGGGGEEKKVRLSTISREALEKMKLDQNFEHLVGDRYNNFETAVYNFEKMGEKAVDHLVRYLRSNRDEEKVVNNVLYTLGRLGKNGERAVPLITSYLSSSNYDYKAAAIAALGRIGKSSEKALPQIKPLLYSEDEWLRHLAERTLRDIDTPQSLAMLKEMKKFEMLKKQREKMAVEKLNSQPKSN